MVLLVCRFLRPLPRVVRTLAFHPRDFVIDLSANQQRQLDCISISNRFPPMSLSPRKPSPTLAEQTTAPVSIITRDEIDERQSVGLADALTFAQALLSAAPGPKAAQPLFSSTAATPISPKSRRRRAINPPGGAVDFSSLTLDNIDKVEIVRGAESAHLPAPDAVSGVIQLFTHRGGTRIPEFSIYGEGGSFASGRGGAQLSGLLGAFDYSIAGSYFGTDGQGPSDNFINRTLSGNFGYSFQRRQRIRLTLRNNDSIAGIPGQTLFEPPNLDQRFTQHLFSSSARWDFVTANTGVTKSAAPSLQLAGQQ